MKIYKHDGRCNISGERENLSQEQLAAKLQLAGLNITQKAVSRMETGKRVIADYELPYLADVLDVTIYYLLGMEEIQRADNYIS